MNTEKINKKEFEKEFKELFKKELAYRDEFRKARAVVENLTTPITKHVRECCQFWSKYFPIDVDKVVIIINNEDGTRNAVEVLKPKLEEASVETYLPFGIDFNQASIVDCL